MLVLDNMLNKYAVFFVFGFLISSIQAQNFDGGCLLGVSTSQVGGDNLWGFHKAGLLIGIFANKSISEKLSFQMEMTYIQKGSNNPNMNEYAKNMIGRCREAFPSGLCSLQFGSLFPHLKIVR